MVMPDKGQECHVLLWHGTSNLKINGKLSLCISANSMIPGSMERERDTGQVTALSITVSLLPPCPGTGVPNLFLDSLQ